MNRSITFALLFVAFVALAGCDKQGIHPYGSKTDVIQSCGFPASVHLHSGTDVTDILILGTLNPAKAVTDYTQHCMMVGSVARDSSTTLYYGGYDLDATGNGTFYQTAEYDFTFQPNIGVSGRDGSARYDTVPPFPLTIQIAVAGDKTTFTLDGTTHTYTAFPSVVANINLADPQGPTDLYQTFNLALFLSQVRIPAFGGLGMTRYINNKTTFAGLVNGAYSVEVGSLAQPTATLTYNGLEDFPGVWVNGDQVTDVNISANGTMHGVLDFQLRDPANPANVAFDGSVDYTGVQISDGIAVSGNYTLKTTIPTATTSLIPYSNAYAVDLTHILPVSP